MSLSLEKSLKRQLCTCLVDKTVSTLHLFLLCIWARLDQAAGGAADLTTAHTWSPEIRTRLFQKKLDKFRLLNISSSSQSPEENRLSRAKESRYLSWQTSIVRLSWVFPSPRLLKQRLRASKLTGFHDACDADVLQPSPCGPSTRWRSRATSQTISSVDCWDKRSAGNGNALLLKPKAWQKTNMKTMAQD